MIEVSVAITDEEDRQKFTFEAEGGSLTAGYHLETGMFATGSLKVQPEYRRRGIAKSLLERALSEARAVGASSFISLIISRECLDAETTVFGDEAITVRKLGTYTPEGEPDRFDTRAVLWLDLK